MLLGVGVSASVTQRRSPTQEEGSGEASKRLCFEDLYTGTAMVSKAWQVAILLLRESSLRRPNMMATSYTAVTAAMSVGEKASAWQMALCLFHELQTMQEPSQVTCNAAISSCEKGSCWTGALGLLSTRTGSTENMANAISFAAAVSACDKAGQQSKAMQLLRDFQVRRLPPTDVFCSTGLTVCQILDGLGKIVALLIVSSQSRSRSNTEYSDVL